MLTNDIQQTPTAELRWYHEHGINSTPVLEQKWLCRKGEESWEEWRNVPSFVAPTHIPMGGGMSAPGLRERIDHTGNFNGPTGHRRQP